jgi:hypothetical protein
MRTPLKIFFTLLVFTGLLGLSAPAFAQESITVEVRSIAASKDGDSFDSSLDDLKSKLTRAFGGYTNFKQVGRTSLSIPQKGSKSTSLANGGSLELTFHGTAGKFVKLGLSIAGKLNTTLKATHGSTFFQAGLNYETGILMLAITVK